MRDSLVLNCDLLKTVVRQFHALTVPSSLTWGYEVPDSKLDLL
jgi:hypothetical protein